MLGKAVLSPGELTRMESLRRAGNEAVPVCLGVAGMLVLAAIIESYLRQSHLSNEARLAFAGLSALAWTALSGQRSAARAGGAAGRSGSKNDSTAAAR